jgi:hypothetical protein
MATTKKIELNGGESTVQSEPVGSPTIARPMASEQVSTGTPEGIVKSPPLPKYLRYELWRDTAFVRRAVRDEEGFAMSFTDAEVAIAALEATKPFDPEDGVPAVHYLRAVYAVDSDGNTAGCNYWTRPSYVRDEQDPGVVHIYQDRAERAAMRDLKALRDRNKTAQRASQEAFSYAAASLNSYRTLKEQQPEEDEPAEVTG